LRRLVLKMYWDGEEEPSVLVPVGDFFGIGHGRTRNFVSAPLQMSPEDGKSFNSFFHMPFADGARIEVTSELEHEEVLLYYYVDYEELALWRTASAASTPSGAGKTLRTGSRRRGRATRSFSSAARTRAGRATTRSWKPRDVAITSVACSASATSARRSGGTGMGRATT
jgi:hypothetical protein